MHYFCLCFYLQTEEPQREETADLAPEAGPTTNSTVSEGDLPDDDKPQAVQNGDKVILHFFPPHNGQ